MENSLNDNYDILEDEENTAWSWKKPSQKEEHIRKSDDINNEKRQRTQIDISEFDPFNTQLDRTRFDFSSENINIHNNEYKEKDSSKQRIQAYKEIIEQFDPIHSSNGIRKIIISENNNLKDLEEESLDLEQPNEHANNNIIGRAGENDDVNDIYYEEKNSKEWKQQTRTEDSDDFLFNNNNMVRENNDLVNEYEGKNVLSWEKNTQTSDEIISEFDPFHKPRENDDMNLFDYKERNASFWNQSEHEKISWENQVQENDGNIDVFDNPGRHREIDDINPFDYEEEAALVWKEPSRDNKENFNSVNTSNDVHEPDDRYLFDYEESWKQIQRQDNTDNFSSVNTSDKVRENDDTDSFDYREESSSWKENQIQDHTDNFNLVNASDKARNNDVISKFKEKESLLKKDRFQEREDSFITKTYRFSESDNTSINNSEEDERVSWKFPNKEEEYTDDFNMANLSSRVRYSENDNINADIGFREGERWDRPIQDISYFSEVRKNDNINNIYEEKKPLSRRQQTQDREEIINVFDTSDRIRGNTDNSYNSEATLTNYNNTYEYEERNRTNNMYDSYDYESRKTSYDSYDYRSRKSPYDSYDYGLRNSINDKNTYEYVPSSWSNSTDNNNNINGLRNSINDKNTYEYVSSSWTNPNHTDNNNNTYESESWRNTTNQTDDSDPVNNGVWMVPPNISSSEVLGEKNVHLDRIEKLTNTCMAYNEDENEIEIWGSSEEVKEAKKQWDNHANDLLKMHERDRRIYPRKERVREPYWARYERASIIIKEQEPKMPHKEEQENEEDIYLNPPNDSQKYPFNGHFIFPQTDIPIVHFIGSRSEFLNPIRTKYKCHIWHEPSLIGTNMIIIKIAGNCKESVESATARVENLFKKGYSIRSFSFQEFHMVEPPHKTCKVRIVDPSPLFYSSHLPYRTLKVKLLKPFYEEKLIPVIDDDILMPSFNSFDNFQEIRELNIRKIEDSLRKAFETIHLFNEEIKIRVRLGHVCLTQVPLPKGFDSDGLLPINQLNERVLKKDRTRSIFATCLATEMKRLKGLFEVLSGGDNKELNGSPSHEYKIRAIRKTSDGKELNCAFNIQLKNVVNNAYDGPNYCKIGLWNSIIIERDILDVNMSCLEYDYSWKLHLKTAKRINTPPQKHFIDKLRISSQGHLNYSNSKEVMVKSVCKKTKWKFCWNKDYIIEITKYEFWDLSESMSYSSEIDSQELSASVSYGVTLYRKSWDDTFAQNINLDFGEAPDWHPYDIMDEEQTGGINGLVNDIQTFLKLLQKVLPTEAEYQFKNL